MSSIVFRGNGVSFNLQEEVPDVTHFNVLSSPLTHPQVVTEICKKEGAFGLLKLCLNIQSSSEDHTTFIQRISSALKELILDKDRVFGEISNETILRFFLGLYHPDNLEKHVFESSFLIDLQNLCVACTGEGEVEYPGNIGSPVFYLVAKMELGNSEDCGTGEVRRISSYAKQFPDAQQYYLWSVFIVKWIQCEDDLKHSLFMKEVLKLMISKKTGLESYPLLVMMEYHHHLNFTNDNFQRDIFVDFYKMSESSRAIERLMLLSSELMNFSSTFESDWWPDRSSRFYAANILNLCTPAKIFLNAINTAVTADKGLRRGISGAVCRLATEVATGSRFMPNNNVEISWGYFNLTVLKEHIYDHFNLATALSSEVPSPDDTPLENAARIAKLFISEQNVQELIDFIFDRKPIVDMRAWKKADQVFKLVERSKVITVEELGEALSAEKNLIMRLAWWVVSEEKVKKQLAKKMFDEPVLFGKWFGKDLECYHLPIQPSTVATTNYWMLTDCLMLSMNHQRLLVEDPLQKSLKRAFSMAADKSVKYSSEEICNFSLWNHSNGRTLLPNSEKQKIKVKIQKKGESNEAFLREFYSLKEIGNHLVSDLPKPIKISLPQQAIPTRINELIDTKGIKTKTDPLLIFFETEGESYWNYAQNVCHDKWAESRRSWLLDESTLLREAGFCHHIGTQFWHNESDQERPRGYLPHSIPGSQLSAGRLNAPKIKYPNVGEGGIRDIGDGWFLSELSKNPSLFSVDLLNLPVRIPNDAGRRAFFTSSWLSCLMLADTLFISQRLQSSTDHEWDWRDDKLCTEVGADGMLGAMHLLEGYTGMTQEKAKIFWQNSGVNWQQWGRELLYWYNTDQPSSYRDHLFEEGELPEGLYPKHMVTSVDLSKVVNKSPIGFSLDGKHLDIGCFNGAFLHIEASKVWNILGPACMVLNSSNKI